MMNSVFIASCISAMAMSSDLLQAKFDNWSNDSQDLQEAQQDIYRSDKDLISAMMQKIQLLESKVGDYQELVQRMDIQQARTD